MRTVVDRTQPSVWDFGGEEGIQEKEKGETAGVFFRERMIDVPDGTMKGLPKDT